MHRITLPLAPMRVSPSHKAEMSNELLYGELVQFHDEYKGWIDVSCSDYEYRGWILAGASEEFSDIDTKKQFMYSEFGHIELNGQRMFIPRGSVIFNETILDGDVHQAADFSSDVVVSMAKRYLNTPYRWGGRSIMGIDCSGFTQIVFMLCGMQIPRDAWQQAERGQNIAFIQEAMPGDLAFFGDSEYSITHVGIIINSNEIIHASERVRIDKIDHEGIYNEELKKYSHKLRLIKRF